MHFKLPKRGVVNFKSVPPERHITLAQLLLTSCSLLHPRHILWRKARNLRRLPSLVDHDDTLEGNHDLGVLVVAGGLHRHDASIWARPGLPLLQHLRLRVDGVAFEDRI